MSTTPHVGGPIEELLERSGRFFTPGEFSDDLRTVTRQRWPAGRCVLPGPLEPRQGGPLHPRRQLHRVVFVEGVCQGRHHHLGDPGDRLPVGGPGPARVRAARVPARRRVFLVHVLADPGAVSRMPVACWSRCTGKPRPGSGDPVLAWADIQADPAAPAALSAGPRQGRVGAGELGRGHRADRGRARAHHQDLRAGSGCRLLADPGDVDGVVRGRVPVR